MAGLILFIICGSLLVVFCEKKLEKSFFKGEVEKLRDVCDKMVKKIDSELSVDWCVNDLVSYLSCERWRSLPCAGDSINKLQEKKKNFIGINYVLNKMI